MFVLEMCLLQWKPIVYHSWAKDFIRMLVYNEWLQALHSLRASLWFLCAIQPVLVDVPCCPLHKNPHTLLARSPLVVSSAISEWWTPTLLKLCCCFHAVFFWWIQFCWSSVTNPVAKTRPQTLGSFPRKAERRNLKPPVTRQSVPGWQLHLDGVFFMGNGIQPTKWWLNGDLIEIHSYDG